MKPLSQIAYEAYHIKFRKPIQKQFMGEMYCNYIMTPYESLPIEAKLAWVDIAEEIGNAVIDMLHTKNVQPH